jgi:hypothetical protein
VYGPVRTVVWQGSAGDRRPYADLTANHQVKSDRGYPGQGKHRAFYVRVSLQYPALIKPPLPEFPRLNDIVSPACLSLGQARRDACCDQEWDGMP